MKKFENTTPATRLFPWKKISAMLLLGLLASCTTPKQTKPQKHVFFPAPPDEPRLQFLVSYGSEKEFRSGGRSFSSYVTGEKAPENPILKPYGIAIRDHKIYVCDTALDAILTLDLSKRRMIGIVPKDEAALKEPINITLDSDGSRYIVDSKRNQVIVLDAKNNHRATIGKAGEKPRDVAIAKNCFYVVDAQLQCIHVYDKTSFKLLDTFPKQNPKHFTPPLYQPTNVALDSKGQIYVCDTVAGVVQVYSKDGYHVRTIGQIGDSVAFGQLKRPKGIAVDREGRLYVADAAYNLVQMYDDQGRYLMWFGYAGTAEAGAMTLPAKVVIDYDHVNDFQQFAAPDFKVEYLVLVTNQYGNRKVSIYGFGHKK